MILPSKSNSPLLVITGPTASGKSDAAIQIAKLYNGEIISADSRQVFRGMDIGTGKVEQDAKHPATTEPLSLETDSILKPFFSQSIAHYLIDIRQPDETYNVTDFVRDARLCIQDIQSRGKLPIICGGTGFWIQALLTEQSFPAVPPNLSLRASLEKLATEDLIAQLKKLDARRADTIDIYNRVRIIRAIEIATALGEVPVIPKPTPDTFTHNQNIASNIIIYVINPPKETLHKKIHDRLLERIKQGMIEEVERLRKRGLSHEKLDAFGLEYRWISRYMQNLITKEEMPDSLFRDIKRYAKRQLTWLRRFERQGANIHWVDTSINLSQDILHTSLEKFPRSHRTNSLGTRQ